MDDVTGEGAVATEIARYGRRGIAVDSIEHVGIDRESFIYGYGKAPAEAVTTNRIAHLGGALRGRQVRLRSKAWIFEPSPDPRDANHVRSRSSLEIMPDSAETAKLLKQKDHGNDDAD
jgi:hypothetical protein